MNQLVFMHDSRMLRAS